MENCPHDKGLWVIVDIFLQHILLAQTTCFYPTCEGDSKMDHIKETKVVFGDDYHLATILQTTLFCKTPDLFKQLKETVKTLKFEGLKVLKNGCNIFLSF